MFVHRSLSESNSPQVSRTLLSILSDFNNAVVWMVSNQPISNSSSPCTNPLVTVPSALITIGITITFMFHSFFSSLAMSKYFHFLSILPYGQLIILLSLLLLIVCPVNDNRISCMFNNVCEHLRLFKFVP